MSQNLVTTVERQDDLGHGHHLIRLAAPDVAPIVKPGEFVMIGLPDVNAMLVRRPFSVARVHPDPREGTPRSVELLYKVFGQRTRAFSELRAGAEMSILGPLGRGFWIAPDDEVDEICMVAGGIGNAIYPLLLQHLDDHAARTTLLFGARRAEDLSLVEWFAERCDEVVLTTEDGSAGRRGLVTDPLIERLTEDPGTRRLVLGCGPTPMLRALAKICVEREVPCQLALEETMACGFGVCLGCVVEKRSPESEFDRFVRVCREGPVFDAREVLP